MTAIQKKPNNPIAHLSAEDIETLGRELGHLITDGEHGIQR